MDPQEPIPVIPLQYAEPERQLRPRWYRTGRIGVALGWLCCLVALALILHEVESVLFTGPILFVIGAVVIVSGAFMRDRWVVLLGAGHCTVCVLFVALVNLRSWNPADARLPFIVMGAAYTLVAAAPTFIVLARRQEM